MIISSGELIDLYEGAYDLEKQAAAITKRVADQLNGYAEANEISKTAIKQAYAAFKKFKEGKVSTKDEDYFTLQAIVEEHFSAASEGTADTVSA